MIKNILIYIVRFHALLGLTVLAGCSEQKNNEFESYAELKHSELIGKGWVPKFIPKSAYDIKESHRVDQPYINVEFSFQQGDISGIQENCSKLNDSMYKCEHAGDPVTVEIINDNYAKIYSTPSNT